MNWFTKKCTHADEYSTLYKRLTQVELRLDDYEAFQNNIRNMARKIQRGKVEETEELNTSNGGGLLHGSHSKLKK